MVVLEPAQSGNFFETIHLIEWVDYMIRTPYILSCSGWWTMPASWGHWQCPIRCRLQCGGDAWMPGTKSTAVKPPAAQSMVDILGSILSRVHHEISKRPVHSDTVLWLAPQVLLRPIAYDQISCEWQLIVRFLGIKFDGLNTLATKSMHISFLESQWNNSHCPVKLHDKGVITEELCWLLAATTEHPHRSVNFMDL